MFVGLFLRLLLNNCYRLRFYWNIVRKNKIRIYFDCVKLWPIMPVQAEEGTNMNKKIPLKVAESIIRSLEERVEASKTQGILNIPLFKGGITKDAVIQRQGQAFGFIMQAGDCLSLISKLKTRLEEEQAAAGIIGLENERKAATAWLEQSKTMIDQIKTKEHQSFPIFSDVEGTSEPELSFAALDPKQIQQLENRMHAGSVHLTMLENKIDDILGKACVEISQGERKSLKELIPGFEYAYDF